MELPDVVRAVPAVDLPFALGVVAVVVAGFALAPLVVRTFAPTRRPNGELRALLAATDGTPDPGEVRVVAGARGERVDAFASGIAPGREYVFVTEALVETFEPAEVAAVLAHESGHLGMAHLRRRAGAAALAGLAWGGVAAPAVGPGAATVGFAATLLVVAVALGVRQEYDADRYAARAVGHDVTVRALCRLERSADAPRTPAPLDRLSARTWLRRRIARLESEG